MWFDLNRKQNVPEAQYLRNPVPNAVRCGARGRHLVSSVLKARYRGVDSGVPLARSAERRHPHPAQQSCTGLLGERAFSTQQFDTIRITLSPHTIIIAYPHNRIIV